MEESLEDALTGLPEEMRTRIAELTEGVPDDLVDEIVYGYLVERCGGLTKEQLLAVDLGKYDRRRLRNPSCWRQRFPLKMARCEARKRF